MECKTDSRETIAGCHLEGLKSAKVSKSAKLVASSCCQSLNLYYHREMDHNRYWLILVTSGDPKKVLKKIVKAA